MWERKQCQQDKNHVSRKKSHNDSDNDTSKGLPQACDVKKDWTCIAKFGLQFQHVSREIRRYKEGNPHSKSFAPYAFSYGVIIE